MTTNVSKGAGRARHAEKKKKHSQRDVVVGGGEHTPALKEAADETKARRKRPTAASKAKAAPEPEPETKKVDAVADTDDGWDSNADLGANVARLRENSITWRKIGEIANANGHEVPWPDGGRLLRAMKSHLGGGPAPTPRSKGSKGPKEKRKPPTAQDREALIQEALSKQSVPWDSETDLEDLQGMIEGHTIFFVSKLTGEVQSARCPKGGKHTNMRVGADGPYITFASTEGPFRSISIKRIIRLG